MTKKKLFIALTIGSFALAGAATVAFTGNHIGFVAANETEYRAVLSEGNSKTDLGNELKLVTEGLTESAGNYGLLAAGGRIDVEVNGAKSIVVNADTHANLTLSLGYKEGVWYKEDLTEWILEDDAIIELKDRPNYVRIEATANTVIESITYNYSCEPTELVSHYFSYGNQWISDGAWFFLHTYNDEGANYDTYYTEYLGGAVYRYEIPEIMSKAIAYRMPHNLSAPNYGANNYGSWNDSGEITLKTNSMYTWQAWGTAFKTSDAPASFAPVTYGLIGSFNSWGGDIELVKDENGVYSVEKELAANDEIKVRENRSWDYSFGNENNQNIKITANGTYRISLVMAKCRPSVEVEKIA